MMRTRLVCLLAILAAGCGGSGGGAHPGAGSAGEAGTPSPFGGSGASGTFAGSAGDAAVRSSSAAGSDTVSAGTGTRSGGTTAGTSSGGAGGSGASSAGDDSPSGGMAGSSASREGNPGGGQTLTGGAAGSDETAGAAGAVQSGGTAGTAFGAAGTSFGGVAGASAGAGGAAPGGAGGSTGALCQTARDCNDDNECTSDICDPNTGQCTHSLREPGVALALQFAGDCRERQCSAQGVVVEVAADDPSDDGNQCTLESCADGTPVTEDATSGTACAGGMCLNGRCVGCIEATDCGVDTACRRYECNEGTCETVSADGGTALPSEQQVAGDCRVLVCDGDGGTRSVADNEDLPVDDGNACTIERCLSGVPLIALKAEGGTCDFEGGSVCRETGECVACLEATQCAPVICRTASCSNYECSYTPLTDVVAASIHQIAGDCSDVWCDGTGEVAAHDNDLDVPVDPDELDCVQPACEAGSAVYDAPEQAGTACAGGYCRGDGTCGECYYSSHCPSRHEATMSCSSGNCVIGSCVTNHYDVDGLVATGCEEVDSTASQSTKESATYLGSFSCNDSGSAQDIEGDIPSDLHTATTSGAKDDFWRIYASGGLCVNDLALTFIVTGSSQADCYQLLVQPDGTDVRSCTPNLTTASCTISAGSGSYDDDTNIYLQVRKTCTADTITEAVSYRITGHL